MTTMTSFCMNVKQVPIVKLKHNTKEPYTDSNTEVLKSFLTPTCGRGSIHENETATKLKICAGSWPVLVRANKRLDLDPKTQELFEIHCRFPILYTE